MKNIAMIDKNYGKVKIDRKISMFTRENIKKIIKNAKGTGLTSPKQYYKKEN